MVSTISSQTIRSLFDQLNSEFDSLITSRDKLTADCQQLKESIQSQIQQIQSLHSDFEKLKSDFSKRQEPPPQPSQTLTEETSEQLIEVTTMVNVSTLKTKADISLVAEIVDYSLISSTAFSPDGKFLAFGSDKILQVYNIERKNFVLEYTQPNVDESVSNHIRSVAWFPDSSRVICGGEDSNIQVIKLDDGSLFKSFKAGTGEVLQVMCSHNSGYFASVSGDGNLNLWRLDDFSLLGTMTRSSAEDKIDAITLDISDNDKTIAVGYRDSVIAFWDVETKTKKFETVCHSSNVYSVKFLSKTRLVSGSLDHKIRFWNIEADRLTLWKELEGHTNFVLTLAVDPKGKWLISGSRDLTLKIISIERGEMIYSIQPHNNSIISVSFHPDGHMFCSGSGDQRVLIWKIENKEVTHDENEAETKQ